MAGKPRADAARPTTRSIDVSMMVVMHDALRRDLTRLAKATDRSRSEELRHKIAAAGGWLIFKNQLGIHHTGEDTALWPRMREKLADNSDALELMDHMESDHVRIEALLTRLDQSFSTPGTTGVEISDLSDELHSTLSAHLALEEREALPLIGRTLTPPQWIEITTDMRKSVGMSGGAEFLPWLLEGAAPERSKAMVGMLPPPARLLYARVWKPKYLKRSSQW